MDETYVGNREGRIPDYGWGSRNFVHDSYRAREQLTLPRLYGNDGNPRRKSSPRIAGTKYRIRVFAFSAGLTVSGIVYSVIQFVR